MKHINKPLEVNLNFMESNDPENNRRAITEGVNILILIFLGCGGLYLYFSICSPKKRGLHFSTITTNASYTSNDHRNDQSIALPTTKKEQLLVKGHREAGEKLVISVKSYDGKADYRIDFGDGQTKAMTNKTIQHIYERPGDYKLQLIINYQDEPVQRITRKINIDEPIEVVSDAYQEK